MLHILTNFLVFISILSSQFYLYSSGLPQPAHFLFIFFVIFAITQYKRQLLSGFHTKQTKLLFSFISYVVIINIFFSIINSNLKFNLSSIYFIYNSIIFIFTFRFMLLDDKKVFFLSFSFFSAILILLILWLMNLGRFNYGDRYNGFFNDPNQMAFWVLCCCSGFFLIVKNNPIIKSAMLFFSSALILATWSRSALIGFFIIFVGLSISLIKTGANDGKSINSAVRLTSIIFGIILISSLIYFLSVSESFLLVLERLLSTDLEDQASQRGYHRIFEYPEYILFGAGQGLDERFNSDLEIHSTWFAILFYYGIIGLFMFSLLIYRIAKPLPLSDILIFLGPIFYGFSTFGARTPIFWVFLACGLFASNRCKKNNSNREIKNQLFSRDSTTQRYFHSTTSRYIIHDINLFNRQHSSTPIQQQ